MRRCSKCGREVEEGLTFCVWCGTALEIPAGPPPLPVAGSADAASRSESPAGPVPPPIPAVPVQTGQPPTEAPNVPRAPAPPPAAAAPAGLQGDATTPADGALAADEGPDGGLDETVVLPQPPGSVPQDPLADTAVSQPPAIPGTSAADAKGPEAAPPPPPGEGPDPGAMTAVSTSRAAAPPGTPPPDSMNGDPTIPGHGPVAAPGSTPQLVEIDEDEPGISEPPAHPPAVAGPAPTAPEPTGDGTRTPEKARPGGGRGWIIAGAAVALVLLLAGAGWWLFGGHRPSGGTAPQVKVIRIGESAPAAAPEGASTPPPTRKEPEAGAPRVSRGGSRPAAKKATAPAKTPRTALFHAAADVSGLAIRPAPAAIVYSGKRFRGRSQTFPIGEVPHLGGTVLHDNAASSLKLVGGARLTLFLKPGFAGRSETFSEDCSSLKGTKIRNNRASSLKVEPPRTGPLLWRAGPIRGLGMSPRLERHRNVVVVRSESEAGAAYVVAGTIPATGGGLEKLLHARAGLGKALGAPRSAAVRVARGRLAVQLFARGVVLYSPASKHGWYRLDGR